jgi:hypothetical protein
MDPALRLHPDQQGLTPLQAAEAEHFAEAYIQTQLSPEPANEQEAERRLRQAYQVVGLAAPQQMHWVDGPRELLAELALLHVQASLRTSVRRSVISSVLDSVEERLRAILRASLRDNVADIVGARVRRSVNDNVGLILRACLRDEAGVGYGGSSAANHRAYFHAESLACAAFFNAYLAPNAAHALAQFNQLVSGYRLAKEGAVIIRRPRVLARDAAGRLHNARGKCIEYRDGWGFYAWHGVRVSERVILAPERLSREDFLGEQDVEARRVIQERMGGRFVTELGGQVIDTSPRGTLYEVALPGDPERVARYVQVRDAETSRQYFLRVPPTVQTAAEAVAWSFQMVVEEYDPAQET